MLAEVEKALAESRQTSATVTAGPPGAPASTGTTAASATLQLPDVIVSTISCLAVAIIGAVPGWLYLSGSFALYLALIIVLMVAGIFVARRSPVSAALALGYSFLLGAMMGAFTHMVVGSSGNIALISQAIIGTVAGAVGMLAVYATPFGRKASRGGKFFVGIMIGYAVIGVANIVAVMLGVGGGWGFYGVKGIGLVLCLLGVALACWSLLTDIGNADRAISSGAPRHWQWSLGMALCASLVWLYLELLRLLAIANR
jgi:uncharacterized YccA/Bax inhibitor family protein